MPRKKKSRKIKPTTKRKVVVERVVYRDREVPVSRNPLGNFIGPGYVSHGRTYDRDGLPADD